MLLIRVRKTGLPRGSVILTVILGIGSGVYIWKPIFDQKRKSEEPDTSGKVLDSTCYTRKCYLQCGTH